MADAVNLQILDALTTRLLTITGIGTRVYDYYRDEGDIHEGKPAICFFATDEDVIGEPIATTRRKLWDMTVGLVAYVEGGDVRAKAYGLVKDIETVVEQAPPTLGIDNVEQARVIGKMVTNMGSNDPQFGIKGMAEVTLLVRYRTNIGAP